MHPRTVLLSSASRVAPSPPFGEGHNDNHNRNGYPARGARAAAIGVLAAAALIAGCSSSSNSSSGSSTSDQHTSGPSGADALPTGVTHSTLDVGGRTRTYRLFVPDGIRTDSKVPLVLALHGGLGTGDQFAGTTGLDEVASTEDFIVAYPDGAALKPQRLRREVQTWNAGRCCGPSVTEKVDDVEFLSALIDSLASSLPIDRTKVGMVGHSNGAMMTWRFACERPDEIAAAVVVAGAVEVDRLADCAPSHGVDLLNIHGAADANVPVAGGKGQGIAGVQFRSQADSLDTWTAAEDCAAPGEIKTTGPLSRQTWSDCKDATVTENLVIADAEHPWPGATAAARTAGIAGTPSSDLDASAETWTFFSSSFDR